MLWTAYQKCLFPTRRSWLTTLPQGHVIPTEGQIYIMFLLQRDGIGHVLRYADYLIRIITQKASKFT